MSWAAFVCVMLYYEMKSQDAQGSDGSEVVLQVAGDPCPSLCHAGVGTRAVYDA